MTSTTARTHSTSAIRLLQELQVLIVLLVLVSRAYVSRAARKSCFRRRGARLQHRNNLLRTTGSSIQRDNNLRDCSRLTNLSAQIWCQPSSTLWKPNIMHNKHRISEPFQGCAQSQPCAAFRCHPRASTWINRRGGSDQQHPNCNICLSK